LTISLSLTN